MRILVTGGAGFIGSALIDRILADGATVMNVDALTYAANPDIVFRKHENYGFHRADICDARAMYSAFADFRPDKVIHLAAESHVDRSIDGPAAFLHTNITGTFTLLEVALDWWRKCAPDTRQRFRFHHVSTDEVYGDLEVDDPGFSEVTPYRPSSPYSASKAASDHLVRAWYRTYGLPVLITNCSNNYGPRQFPEKLIPLMILNAIEGRSLPVYGDGLQSRDWLHVEDHAHALWEVAQRGTVGETYNIGGNSERRNGDVVRLICEILETERPQKPAGIDRYAELITSAPDRPGHDRRYAIDAGKLERELGVVPSRSFEDGLRETVRWYLQNRAWCERILRDENDLSRVGLARMGAA